MLGNSFLRGRESRVWTGRRPQEMVTLAQRQMERDPFSKWISTRLLDIYDKIWGHRRKEPINEDPDSGIVDYEDTRLAVISNAVAVIFASLVPTVSVLVLYFIKNMLVRIGLLVLFTAVFAAALALFTNARKIEIFSAIAAYVLRLFRAIIPVLMLTSKLRCCRGCFYRQYWRTCNVR